jgi:hypothetical protein
MPEPNGITDCTEWQEREVTADELLYGCERSMNNGITPADTIECTDGTTLWWTESLWGYVGEVGRSRSDPEKDAPDDTTNGAGSKFDAAKLDCRA